MKFTNPDHAVDAMATEHMPVEALQDMAAYFQVLAEPTRLQILNLLRDGERNVGDLAQLCGFTAANISRHLALMSQHGLVQKQNRGTSVYYRIADAGIFDLCDLVCGNITRQWERSALKRTIKSTTP